MKVIQRALGLFMRKYATPRPPTINSGFRKFSAPTLIMSSAVLPDITATPAAEQLISHHGKNYTTIKEGLAYILIPAEASKVPQTAPQGENQAQSVFYNPIQQFNRDLSVLAIKAYAEDSIIRKENALEKAREKSSSKRKEKKRKREESLGDVPRKAGKIDNSNTVSDNIPQSATATTLGNSSIDKEGEASKALEVVPQVSVAEEPKFLEENGPRNEEQDPKIPPKPRNPTFTILDALSATGLRALRYANEIPFATSITANDLLPTATETIKLNVRHNKLDDKIRTVTGNALTHMYNLVGESCKGDRGQIGPSKKYDVIDLDPYGTAAPFLDAAVQSVRDDGGLLCITCTDAGVWASNGYPEKAYSLYGGAPIKGMHSHEGGLRLILHSIATSAARYGLAIEPLLSLSIDFYARVFVRIHKSAADVKFLAGKTMIVYNCDTGCGAWTTQMVAKNKLALNKSGKGHFWKHVLEQAPSSSEKCLHCGMTTHLAGPMYAGPLQSPEFINKILDGLPSASKDTYQTTERIEGMLTMARDEFLSPPEDSSDSPTLTSKTQRYDPAAIDLYPFFFIPSVLAKVVHCITPHENALRGALRNLGYRVTRSHTKPGSIKTDAPWEVIWEVMREWVRQKAPVKEGAIRVGTAGWKIMGLDKKVTSEDNSKERTSGDSSQTKENNDEQPKSEIIFDEALGREKDGKKLVRFQLNPRENWGPMNRAKGHA